MKQATATARAKTFTIKRIPLYSYNNITIKIDKLLLSSIQNNQLSITNDNMLKYNYLSK